LILENILNRGTEIVGQFNEANRIFPRAGGEQIFLTWKRFMNHYGVVGILALFSALFIKRAKYRKFYEVLIATVLTVLIITYAKGILSAFFDVALPYHPTQQKFGKVIFLAFVLLSCFSLSAFAKTIWKYRSKTRVILTGLMAVFLLAYLIVGFSTILNFLKNPWFEGWNMSRSNEMFREDNNIVNRIREFATSKDVIAVPEELERTFSYLTGLNVLYLPHHRTYRCSREFAKDVLFASKELREKIEHVSALNFERIFDKILRSYNITYFIVSKEKERQYDRFDCMSYCGMGVWKDGKAFSIFRVNKALIKKDLNQAEDQKLDLFFKSRENYRLVLGYYPLNAKRHLSPGLFQSRDLKPAGLTWGDKVLWLADSEKRRIYKIDPNNGKILGSLINPALRPGGIAWDGEALWSVDGKKRTIYRLNPKSGQIMRSIAIKAARIGGLSWGDGHLWNVDYKRKIVYKISPVDGEVVSIVRCPYKMRGVSWKNGSLWIFDWSGSKICEIFLNEKQQSTRIFGNRCYQWSKLAWSEKGTLWAFDLNSKALVEFDSF